MMAVCSEPDCPEVVDRKGRCGPHEAAKLRERHRHQDAARGTASSRGYGYRWARRRKKFLKAHSICVLCGTPATDADHFPETRRELVAAGITDPDAMEFLRPLCHECHSRSTYDDGGRW